MFGLAAVHRESIGGNALNKFNLQIVSLIAIRHCPNSNGLQIQIYNPTIAVISCDIDVISPSKQNIFVLCDFPNGLQCEG